MNVKIVLALTFLIVSFTCVEGEHEKNHHAKHKSHHNNDHHAKRKTIFHHHLKHQSRDGNCRLICDESANNATPDRNNNSSDNANLPLVYNGPNDIGAVVNVSANVSSVIDYRNNIYAILNGTCKSGVIIDLSSKIIRQLSNNNLLWDASKSSIEEFINSQKCLSAILKAAQEHGKEIEGNNSVIASLTTELGSNLKDVNSTQLLQELSEISKLLNGTLKGLYIENGSVFFAGGLQRLNFIHLGLGKLLSNVNGGLQGVLNGSKINVTEILSASNALEILAYVLKQIGARSDLENILGDVLNNKTKLQEVIHLLTGKQTTGVDGIIALIWHLRVSSGAPNPADLLSDILNLLESGKPISSLWNDFVSALQSVIAITKEQQQQHGANSLQGLEDILSRHITGNVTFGNVHLSEVIKVLQSDNISGGLYLTVKILISLGNANQSIPQLFQSVSKLVNGTDGAQVLSKLIPGINASSLNNPQQVMQSILKKILSGSGGIDVGGIIDGSGSGSNDGSGSGGAEVGGGVSGTEGAPVTGSGYDNGSASGSGGSGINVGGRVTIGGSGVSGGSGSSGNPDSAGGSGFGVGSGTASSPGSGSVSSGGSSSVGRAGSIGGSVENVGLNEKKHEKAHHKYHQKEHHKEHYKSQQKEHYHQ